MKKIYWIIPVLLLAIFSFYFKSYIQDHRIQKAALAQATAAENERIAEERREYQKRVQEEARAAAEARASAKAEKEAREAAEEAAWVALNDELAKAIDTRSQLSDEVYQTVNAFYVEEDRRNRLEERLQRMKEEQAFLEAYLPRLVSNRERVTQLLQKANELESSRIEAQSLTQKR